MPAPRSIGALAGTLALVVVVCALGFYGAPAVKRTLHVEQIYPGVQAAGVDVGDRTLQQATQILDERLGRYGRTSIAVKAGDRSLTLTAAQLGFHPQAAEIARLAYDSGRDQGVIGFISRSISGAVLGDVGVPGSAMVDQQAVDAAVAQIASQTDRPPVDAVLALSPEIELSQSSTGQSLDRAAAREALVAYLVAMRSGALELPTTTIQPTVATSQLEPIRQQASSIVSRGLSLTGGQQTWAVPADLLGSALVLKTGPFGLGVKSSAFVNLVAQTAAQVEREPVDASVSVDAGNVVVSPDVPGQTVDQAATLARIGDAILGGSPSVELVVRPVPAKQTAASLQAVASDARDAIARGLVLTVSGNEVVPLTYTLTAKDLGGLLQFSKQADGSWSVGLGDDQVVSLVSRVNAEYQYPDLTARPISWSNGKITVRNKTVSAVVIDQKKAVAAIEAGWKNGKVALPAAKGRMTVDQAFLNRLNADLKGTIQQRSISFAGSMSQRAHNIRLALSRLDGTLIAPGETFSFNAAVGPTTIANGYQWGFGYTTGSDGQSTVVPSEGGGICQVATTVFQPVFFAGYQIEKRSWHMFPMQHYAVPGYLGLDATVDPPWVDLKFTNTTDHYLLIQAGTRGSSTYVGLVTVKPSWTVKVSKETLTDFKPAPTEIVRSTSSAFRKGQTIIAETAQQGFTSHITRTVTTPDGKVRTLNLKSVYQPSALTIVTGTG